jgi:hypothetical protein
MKKGDKVLDRIIKKGYIITIISYMEVKTMGTTQIIQFPRRIDLISPYEVDRAAAVYFSALSGMYSTMSLGWQPRALHIRSMISMFTGSFLENRATVFGVKLAKAYRSVFLRPFVAKSMNKGLYEILILSTYIIIEILYLKVKIKSSKINILLDNIFQR